MTTHISGLSSHTYIIKYQSNRLSCEWVKLFITMQKNDGGFRTLPISEVHDTTIVLGMVVDSRMSEVMLMGRLGLFGSTPFLVGGRYPCGHNQERITYDSGQPVQQAGGKKGRGYQQHVWTHRQITGFAVDLHTQVRGEMILLRTARLR